ncbi:MAG: DDE-type integrase/transposase/recombinase [Acidobacteriota bacterium]|nr:DDE-type integrase/transposase/recombinase [Acidobacteriota bacterium]
MQFVTECLTELYTVTELAADYGISRKTAYYWLRHYERDGPGRLAGASRRPHRMPRATPLDLVARLVAARQQHPTWGAGKLRDWLVRREPTVPWPCRDTIHTVLTRAGLVRRRRRPHRAIAPPRHLTVPTAANQVWTVDFKGEFATGDGVLCYPLTLRDGYSRYILRCAALPSVRTELTQPQLVRAFAEYGLPDRIRSDNGPPFGAPALAGLSRLAVWWLRLGILPERIRPGCPGENGSHEQFHAVLKRETAQPAAATRAAQQQRFRRFVAEYNHERPHEAVDHAPPATRYTPSPRPYPARLPAPEYPLAWPVRRVMAAGQIKWRGRRLFLTAVLAGEDVALEPVDDGRWLVRFTALPLALWDERTGQLRSPVPPPSPSGA